MSERSVSHGTFADGPQIHEQGWRQLLERLSREPASGA